MNTHISVEDIDAVGRILLDHAKPLKQRFRALFTLRNLGGENAINKILECFDDTSELLKHELAYCLGQMQNNYAVNFLINVLEDNNQEVIVRHEAGEALGAIGPQVAVNVLKKHAENPTQEIAETCQIALRRIQWVNSSEEDHGNLPNNPYNSVDPAPPSEEQCTEVLKAMLLDVSLPMFERYRALFTLRNRGDIESVLSIAEGLKCPESALFRHEIAYVLGQIQHEASIQGLSQNLQDLYEHPMVRHECAEALGSIATKECQSILQNFLEDKHRVVRESCEVALDMCDYELSGQFQYADGIATVKDAA